MIRLAMEGTTLNGEHVTVCADIRIEHTQDGKWRLAMYIDGRLNAVEGFFSWRQAVKAMDEFRDRILALPGAREEKLQ